MATVKSTPKDIQVMTSILRDVGVQDYEPKVLNQMLEFCYRFVTTILEDAQKISAHAKKKTIDKSDVILALAIHLDKHFVLPPQRELLLEYAETKNNLPLPFIKSTAGPRLPPDRYSLTACNYRLKVNKKKNITPNSRVNLPYFPSSSTVNKMNPGLPLINKSTPLISSIIKSSPATISKTIGLPTSNISSLKPPSTPIIKFSDGNRCATPTTPSVIPILQNQPPMPTVVIKSDLSVSANNSIKRKREDEDDNYDI